MRLDQLGCQVVGFVLTICAVAAAASVRAEDAVAAFADELDRSFVLDGDRSILKAQDCGLVNGLLSVNGWIEDVAEVRRVHAPPYFCDDLSISFRFNGARVPATHYVWRPEVLLREGRLPGWKLASRLYPIAGERAFILEIAAENIGTVPATLKVEHALSGHPSYLNVWKFSSPQAGLPTWQKGVKTHESGARPSKIAYAASTFGAGPVVLADVPPGGRKSCHFAFAIGGGDETVTTVRRALADPVATIRASVDAWRARVRALAAKVPRLETDDDALMRLYSRSLLHFLLCEWNVPEFVVRPYYPTGGLFGSCLCSYLWNIGGPYRMWPLVAPEAIKDHLRVDMKLELTKCYAFNPCDGGPVGPYYPINQEKMIFLIHAYVMETGDVAFLKEVVDGKSVIARIVEMALTHDDLSRPAVLADYGAHNDHLELRRGYLYDGEMPDMNLRRIVLLHRADALCRLAGHDPQVDLLARADALKKLCRERLWDASAGWFSGRCSDGKRTTRWTIQMFKALGWGDWVLDKDAADALVRHLMDPREFLGDYGIHSLAKTDVAYDENDVDNGGPGACVSFAPAVVDRLYADGRVDEAETVLRRLAWLGECFPYWGDSQYADRKDYRHDTPLQLNIEGGGLAQTIIFGLFGIDVADDFSVVVAPHLPKGTDHIALTGVRLAGLPFDVRCTRAEGTVVTIGGLRLSAPLNGKIVLPSGSAKIVK